MKTNPKKPKKNTAVSHKKTDGQGISGFVDNRPEAVVQRKIQSLANTHIALKKEIKPKIHDNGNSNIGSLNFPLNTQVVQYRVFNSRDRRKKREAKTWYTDLDENTFFETKEKAQLYEKELIQERNKIRQQEKRRIIEERNRKRELEYEKMMREEYSDYKPPKSSTSRLFKGDEKKPKHDDVNLTELDSENIKEYMEMAFKRRRGNKFDTETIKLNDKYFVLQKGTDIGLTPAKLQPEKKVKGKVPLRRIGKPPPYSVHAKDLDRIVKRRKRKQSEKSKRQRVGKDIDRLTRGNSVKNRSDYNEEEMNSLKQFAPLVRLDKGRVPKSTKHIRKKFTKGKYSFHDLLVNGEYVGAQTGGVERLREKQQNDGNLSEGSDMEEEKLEKRKVIPIKKKKRRRKKKRRSAMIKKQVKENLPEKSEIVEEPNRTGFKRKYIPEKHRRGREKQKRRVEVEEKKKGKKTHSFNPERRMPNFTVQNWTHGPNILPDFIIGRGVMIGQHILINGVEYRVCENKSRMMKPTNNNLTGRFLYVFPVLKGG